MVRPAVTDLRAPTGLRRRIERRDPPRRSGFALLTVLFSLLVLTGVLHATLVLARFQGFAGWAEARVLKARLAAQSGVRFVAADAEGADLRALAGGDTVLTRSVSLDEETRVMASVRWLAREWYWIEGEGRTGSGASQGIRRLAALYWSLDPIRRVEALRATVEAGEEVVTSATGSITPFLGGADDPGYAAGVCTSGAGGGTPPAVPFGGLVEPRTVVLSDPEVEASPSGLGSIPPLGLLDGDALLRRMGPGGAYGAEPPSAGVGGVGTSSAPSARDPAAFQVVIGSYTLPSDGFAGLLAVTGDLEVPPGRRLTGLVLVGGAVTVHDGARILGGARVRETVTVEGDGMIIGSPCAILEILRDLPTLSTALPAPGGTWIDLP
ncbi:MAG: hypothetical protein R3234_14015 [Thermoanaerobaculia bacterium]|nr:hypothetical protein [Thermoanaerobaculia bacterium]